MRRFDICIDAPVDARTQSRRKRGRTRWENRLPPLPAGDIVGAAETAFRASYIIGGASERADGLLRQWTMAGLSLLAIALVLGAATLFGQ